MKKERTMDFVGIGVITLLTLAGTYFSRFTESSFPDAGFIFGIAYFFVYKTVGKKSFEEMHFNIRGLGAWLKRPVIWLWISCRPC